MERKELGNGNYSVVYYYNDNDESVPKEQATKCIICEFDSENKLVKEARFLKQKEQTDEDYGIKIYDNPGFPNIKR